ncbi:MAG: tetratricopeptide repeat protein [Bacteroidetes bacterium]|nr:tetratricopeptide repeat protein [Bacteroidota bacterium]
MKNISLFLPIFIILVLIISGCSSNRDKAKSLLDEGAQLAKSEKYETAILKYEEALVLDPENAAGYNLLGMAYRFRYNQTGTEEFKTKEIDAFKKAIEIDPKLWIAYKNIAASLYYRGNKKEALPYIEKALELQPNDPEKEILLNWIEEAKK